jgi:hypothetical protein
MPGKGLWKGSRVEVLQEFSVSSVSWSRQEVSLATRQKNLEQEVVMMVSLVVMPEPLQFQNNVVIGAGFGCAFMNIKSLDGSFIVDDTPLISGPSW